MSAEELRLQKEKVRIYLLARELDMESKDLLDICRQAGFDVKNQLSSLDPDQIDQVKQLSRRGGGTAVAESPRHHPHNPAAPVAPVPVLPPNRPRTLDTRPRPMESKPPTSHAPAPPAPPVTAPIVKLPPPAPPSAAPPEKPVPAPTAAPTPAAPPAKTHVPARVVPSVPAVAPNVVPPPPTPLAAPPVVAPPAVAAEVRPEEPLAPVESPTDNKPPDLSPRSPTAPPGRMRDLGGATRTETNRPKRTREILRPQIVRVAQPPQLKKPIEKKVEVQPKAQTPIMKLSSEMTKTGGPVNVTDLMKQQKNLLNAPVLPVDVEVEDEEGADHKGGSKVRPGGVAGRDQRHKNRNARAQQRKTRGPEVEVLGGKVIITDEADRHHKHRGAKKVRQRGPTQPRKGRIPIVLPITVRSLSEAVGAKSGELLFRLRDHGLPVNITINSSLEPDMAEAMAIEYGCELEIKRPQNAEEEMIAGSIVPDNLEDLIPRAPIVTIMGHVDHGKTSLLDKIRKSNVAATEAGGITQVIRAWRVMHNDRPITFLDTPGHEAFTKMRARGANVTDIAVIVVAADDGVMPQTQEAINHAKAAGVWIVVAINKVDLPNANVLKTRQQLYSLELLPDNMGGDVPFVETSAATGKGIDDLLENLSLVAELKELKANPNKPAQGTCLEANLSEGEGVFATLLVRDGTLHRGDVILCGASFGRVRAMYDDLGNPIQEAGPSVPVRITGLDEVPNADDAFQVVEELTTAREIADKRKARHLEASLYRRAPVGLENLNQVKIAELKVILKADFRGSIEAIRKELEKLYHEEVRVRILHAAIGGITESDVQLALTSPEDTIIVGFNVVPDDRAHLLAEERGVQIREYNIIYNLTDDIRAALEGKLKPREEVVHLGRAIVRETFKISRVGTAAGCYVTQGTIERSAKVRVIRDGVVIYPPHDRTASLESLKRFKEDHREVREGFECGMKIAGYDDIKVGDVIEAYRVEHMKRTLS